MSDGAGYQTTYGLGDVIVRYGELKDVVGIPFHDGFWTRQETNNYSASEYHDKHEAIPGDSFGVVVFEDKFGSKLLPENYAAIADTDNKDFTVFAELYTTIVN